MKVGVWSALCCLLLATCFLDVSDTECTDSDDSRCSKDRCDQPRMKNKCMKTCGLCDDEPGQTICRNGTWGRGCTRRCSVGCVDRVCHKESGVCDCKPCYEGQQCTDVSYRCTCTSKGNCECKAGLYGEKCKANCHENCLHYICNSKGTCTEGCDSGRYGDKCDRSCSKHCLNKACNRSGNCTLGCDTGWFGHDCSSPCPPGCESCGKEDGRCLKSRVSGLVVWVVLPVLVIILLIIAIVVLVARLMRIESLKKHTNQMPGFYQGSPEGALFHQGDEVQLLGSRDQRPLPPLPGGPSPDTMSSEPKVETEEPESYIIIRHL